MNADRNAQVLAASAVNLERFLEKTGLLDEDADVFDNELYDMVSSLVSMSGDLSEFTEAALDEENAPYLKCFFADGATHEGEEDDEED